MARTSLLALTLLAACATTGKGPTASTTAGQPAEGGATSSGAPATDFTLRDVDGQTVRLSDFAGKVVLLDFWATWCVPCEAEIPHLERLYQARKDRGLVVLGIAMDGPETISQVPAFVRRHQLSFPMLLDEETRVVGIYNPKRTAPLSILIDRQGKIARVRAGFNPGDEKLIEADVEQVLARP